MKHLWPLLTWILLSSYPAESRKGLGHGSKREVFFLNLEDGYFGCQVNESTDVLQLLELSKLCDHRVDCYQGVDEQRNKLKCTVKYNIMRMSVNIDPVIYLPTVQILLAVFNVPAFPDTKAMAFIARVIIPYFERPAVHPFQN
ncbi:hypothetical protein ALC60_05441 [Trachymyrmex zeteki]|uniref:Uncharacterized protein n=1 Tax=Mycetomoellerius zeteki TaxID=64791 RepID=A0A151X5X9_9HYME|nr:hypothetical protein ALC60_05441 [Trachymyrmex zeteki]